MQTEFVGDSFHVQYNGKQYNCRPIQANGRMLYQIDFNGSFIYLTKSINQHRIYFWTPVPQDLKLIHLADKIGKQIENHLISQLCATTTVSK
jgi:hypothetical protein